MNWKLILTLSLFGLAMALLTITTIPSKIEPVFWLIIFIICAYYIAKRAPGKYFAHGLMVSLVNCVWITAIHVIMSDTYITHHHDEAAQYAKLNEQAGLSIKEAMLIIGPIVGIISGLVLGLFSFIASKVVKKKTAI
jgi:putative membrane protein (TIGR04086 family)